MLLLLILLLLYALSALNRRILHYVCYDESTNAHNWVFKIYQPSRPFYLVVHQFSRIESIRNYNVRFFKFWSIKKIKELNTELDCNDLIQVILFILFQLFSWLMSLRKVLHMSTVLLLEWLPLQSFFFILFLSLI